MKIFTVFFLLIAIAKSYLQLKLSKQKLQQPIPENQTLKCQTPAQGQQVQVCYLKDIAYTIELYNRDQLFHLAVDMTSPISWIKSQHCLLSDSKKKKPCYRIKEPIKQAIKNKFKKKKKHDDQDEKSQNYKSIVGMDKISGQLQKLKNLEFWTRDSSKLTSLYNLLLIGFFMTDQKDKLSLQNTNFINASLIPTRINKLCDGALSLRFDEEAQNSFLQQIFKVVKQPQKIVTVYIGDGSMITLGSLSVKHAQKGYSGIEWLELDSKKYPDLSAISLELPEQEQIQTIQFTSEVIFTLSASYISFPSGLLQKFIVKLNSNCKIDANKYLMCEQNENFESKNLIFELGDLRFSLSADKLMRSQGSGNYNFNIRQSQSNFVVLGEPLFQKYFFAFDYGKNKIGIAQKRVTLKQQLFDVISLVRFLTLIFFIGCCSIICFNPVRKMCKAFSLYYKMNKNSAPVSQERNSLRYSNIQENNYDDIRGKIQGALSDSIQGI